MKRLGFKNAVLVLFILITGTLFTGCGFRYSFSSGFGTHSLDREDAKEFKIEKAATDPITSIEIDTRIADVELIQSDDYYVEIDYLYWEDEPDYTLEDGKLSFDDRGSFPDSYSINFNLDNSIRIYLPEAAELTDLSIDNSSGDVNLSSFAAEDLNTTVSYGNFTMKDAAAVKADIILSSGRSIISDFQAGELNFKNSYGNADFTNINSGDTFGALQPSDADYRSIDINMSSGNVDMDGISTDTLEIKNSYGDINCKDITADTFKMDLSSGNLEVSKSSLQKVDVGNSYGDVTLRLIGTKEDYSLDLDTSYGHIKVADESYDDHVILDSDGTGSITANLSSGDVEVSFQE